MYGTLSSPAGWRLAGFCKPALGMLVAILASRAPAEGPFRVLPYLQNPGAGEMTVMWFSEAATTGQVVYGQAGNWSALSAAPVAASALDYHSTEWSKFPGGVPPSLPYAHHARLTGLVPGLSYTYIVTQDGVSVTNEFRSPPPSGAPVRFIAYGDSETEPESTGVHTQWPEPGGSSSRLYLVDQTQGYAENLKVMAGRNPDFVLIAGDLTQAGGEQRDWDEFWRHNAGALNDLAGAFPILPAPGNHEYYGGTRGSYNQPSSEQSVAKYITYFEVPPNGAANPAHEQRYYRVDYGPVTVIMLDTCNGDDGVPANDTSVYLSTATGSMAPDFNPGTPLYGWLETQLASAQTNSRFTFVAFHHTPYSVGPHGSAGESQSGVPLRVLTPLFHQYGVDAVLAGHDEMYEHSAVPGNEQLPGGGSRAYTLHVYDVGIGGDGLRAPVAALTNDKQVFLAHDDAPEIWQGGVLLEGGKHYGHVEVNVNINGEGLWQAVLTPAYVLPLLNAGGSVTGFVRRVYEDETVLLGEPADPDGNADGDPLTNGEELSRAGCPWVPCTSSALSKCLAVPGQLPDILLHVVAGHHP